MLDENGILMLNAPKRPMHFTAQVKRSHVIAFEASTQTMTAYCEEQGIPLSTFSAWVTKYSKKKQAAFVPVQAQSEPPSQPTLKKQNSTQFIEIHRGDLKVVLPVMNDAAMAIEIIKGVFVCN